MSLPPALAAVMIAFRPLFSNAVFERALVLTVGALLAVRTRTVTAALRVTGRAEGSFSVVALAADDLHASGELGVRQRVWYRKSAPTFSDALAGVREMLWRDHGLWMSRAGPGTVEIPRALLLQLTSTLAYAA